jgi:Pvc16 N-terminal domain
MPISPLGVLDLSIVTHKLIQMLTACRDNSPLWKKNGGDADLFTISISGAAPETVRDKGGCHLSLYLFHVEQDKFQMNSPVMGKRAQPIPFQPMSLNLYYLLTAFAKDNHVEEQRAMSIAMRCFHENPIVHHTVTLPLPPPTLVQEEFTLTMAVESADEMARMWQAVTSPMRLSAVYRVSVVFVSPPATPSLPKPVEKISLSADPTTLPYADFGQVIGSARHVSFAAPDSTVAVPEIVELDFLPATVAPNQDVTLYGAGLSQPTAKRVYLLAEGAPEREVTSWIVPITNPFPPPATILSDSKIILRLPDSIGTPPANSPSPGVYQLRVGSDTVSGDPATYRSNATPFSVAARIDVGTLPPNPAILSAPYQLHGRGFIAGHTEVLLDTVALAESGAPLAGHFQISVGGTVIDFQPPLTLGPGRYSVRVRVNQVEADPSWWIII